MTIHDLMLWLFPEHHSRNCIEAHWTKSRWHGWVYGWKLRLVTTVAAVWILLAAELTPASVAGSEATPPRLEELPEIVRFLLSDTSHDDAALHKQCVYAH